MKHGSRERWALVAIVLACAAGITLRVSQLLLRGNLWLDEAMLAQSIVHRSPRGLLFSPLEYHQLAPPGFLQLEKLSTLLISPLEVALRLPATVYSVGALLLFAALAAKRLKGLEPLVAVLVFALAPLVIAYAAEAKQYAGDVFCTVLISYAALELRVSRYSSRWLAISVGIGLVVVWFSDAASMVLAGVGLALAVTALLERDRNAVRPTLVLGATWSAAVIAAQIGVLRRAEGGTTQVMRSYWREHFMPLPRSLDDAAWLPRALEDIYANSLGLRLLGGFTIVLALAGVVAMWRRGDRAIVAIFFAPVLLALAASLARLYPFAGRLTLFLLPAFVIALAAGVGAVGGLARRHATPAQLLTLLLLLSPTSIVAAARPLPWRHQQIDPLLAYVARNRLPGDRMYVYWGGVPAAIFYGGRHGLTHQDFTQGELSKDWKTVAADVARLRGSSRVWLVFSHDLVPGLRDSVLHRLDSIGSRYEAVSYSSEGARAFLYDLR